MTVAAKSLPQKLVEIVMATLGTDEDSLDRQAGFWMAVELFDVEYDDLYRVWLDQTYDRDLVIAMMKKAVLE